MLKRYLLSYTLLCVLPFIILGILLSNMMGNVISEELLRAAEVSLDESQRTLSALVADARQLSLSVAGDDSIQELIRQWRAEPDAEVRLTLLQALNKAMDRHQMYGSTNMRSRLALVSDGAGEREQEFSRVQLVSAACEENWYRMAVDGPKRFHWKLYSTNDATSLRQSKQMYDNQTWELLPAVVMVDINPERLRAIAMSKGKESGRLYLVEENGVIIYPYYNYDKIPGEVLTAKNGSYQAGDRQLLVHRMADTGWNLIRVVRFSDIHEQSAQVKTIILVTALLFLLLSVLAAAYFTMRISNPLSRLTKKMRHVRAGSLTPIESKGVSGEIAELYDSYNYMIERLNAQIQRTYVSRIHEKNAELRALQAQINPHFLYNTLDSINWMALRIHADDISNMVVALSDMLRFSLNKGRNTLLIQDELRQVDAYITLQKMRYSNRFGVEYDVEEGTRHKRIIKMLLQPLVENAIVHGFEEIQGGGLIRISIHAQGDELRFEVCNNGAPIDLERMQQRLAGGDGEENRGYGIRNVNERIKAQYGEAYQIQYSVRDGMTVASFTIPQEVNRDAADFDCG